MVNSVTGSDPVSASTYMKKSTGMNSDDFMKLFITSLQHQDPMKPQDSSEFMAQMAQLTQVEQAYNTNTNLGKILDAQNASQGYSAVSMVGKEIVAKGSQVLLQSGSQTALSYNLPSTAERVEIAITDAAGLPVRTLVTGKAAQGDASIVWDGKDSTGKTLPTGGYSFSVTGNNTDGTSFSGTTMASGKVDGMKMVAGKPVLLMGNAEIPLADLIMVREVKSSG